MQEYRRGGGIRILTLLLTLSRCCSDTGIQKYIVENIRETGKWRYRSIREYKVWIYSMIHSILYKASRETAP